MLMSNINKHGRPLTTITTITTFSKPISKDNLTYLEIITSQQLASLPHFSPPNNDLLNSIAFSKVNKRKKRETTMKLLQLFITFLYFVFSSSIQTNGLIFTSARDHSYMSSAGLSSSSAHFADRNPDPLSIPKSYISAAPSTSPDLSDSNNANFKALEIQIATANRDAHLAVKISQNILGNPSTTIMIRKCLGQCIENYNTIVDDLTKATNDLHAKDIYMVKEDISSIEDDISACRSCFKDMVGGQSPLKPYEDSIKNTASTCLAILSQT